MEKTIRLDQPIAELVKEYPEVVAIMKELGFVDITNPVMLKTVGKYMTLEKGMKLKKKNIEEIKRSFGNHGFKIA